jgi:hypothetical protein
MHWAMTTDFLRDLFYVVMMFPKIAGNSTQLGFFWILFFESFLHP